MKYCLLTLCVIAWQAAAHDYAGPQGSVQIDWPVQHVTRVMSSGYGDSFGMEADVLMGMPSVETHQGHRCVASSYLLFDIDDDFAFDIDETVELELLLADSAATRIAVAYDRNALAESLFDVDLGDAHDGFVRQAVTLPRARFANRGEAGGDLMIAGDSVYYPGTADANHRIILCGLGIKRSFTTPVVGARGRLSLLIEDENDRPVPARVGIYDASGRMPLPSSRAIPFYDDDKRQIFLRSSHGKITPWPHSNRYVFYVDGSYRADLPAGDYELLISRGPEYRMAIQSFSVRADETTVLTTAIERFVDMPGRGWYSGDDHVHIERQAEDNRHLAQLLRAEDIHVTNMLQMGNPANPYFRQYAFGEDGRYFEGHHGIVPGVEDPRTALRGHTISLDIREVLRPQDSYLQYDRTFREYAKQGALSGYAHVAGEWFNAARGLALDVPLGVVDFVEVLQDGELGTALWYDFLNLGFKLVPTAGSDYPYLNQPGAERNYVRLDRAPHSQPQTANPAARTIDALEFSVDAWFANLAAGRTFVTNGPILAFSVAGHGMGSTIEAAPGDQLDVWATATLNPDFEQLDRIELVVNGDVVMRVPRGRRANVIEMRKVLPVERGFWLAARAYGVAEMVAHTAPVYIVTDERGFRADDKAPEIIQRLKQRLREFEGLQVDARQELETWEVEEPLQAMLRAQRSQILDRVDEAQLIYDAILDDVNSWH